MNWAAIGAIGEILGAVAVFISLLYLAIQIRQSTRWQQTQAFLASTSDGRRWMGRIIEDPELNNLFQKGRQSYSELTSAETSRFDLLIVELFSMCETYYEYGEKGYLPDYVISGVQDYIRTFHSEGWLSDWWTVNRVMLASPLLRAAIDKETGHKKAEENISK